MFEYLLGEVHKHRTAMIKAKNDFEAALQELEKVHDSMSELYHDAMSAATANGGVADTPGKAAILCYGCFGNTLDHGDKAADAMLDATNAAAMLEGACDLAADAARPR